MPARNPERLLTYESIVEEIKGQILMGSLRPGDRLPTIAERARELNISQGSVREAYRVLESRGYLEVAQGRGTFVATDITPGQEIISLNLGEVPTRAHLLEARRLLEPQVAALAAERATSAERNAIVAASEETDPRLQEPRFWGRHNMSFHALICHASHNPVVSEMVLTLYKFFEKAEPHPSENPLVREKGKHFHRLIALAIQEGDSTAAHELMKQHIASVETVVSRAQPGNKARRNSRKER